MPADERNTQSPGFSVTVADASAGSDCPSVKVTGELDLLTSPRLQEALVSVIDEQRPRRVVADLTAVTFFDSSALNTLLQVQRHAEERDVTLVVSPSRQVQRVIDLTGVAEHLEVSGDPAP
ncbi:STAS domain-containing protein [Amycolatopsis anabasis]|uniref:STAS domain-containing protein n=1 Tax=Amycolatopsis anabasis TaxID=1840409 RepID=UPI00131CD637|nr:STAS domain-containing protein [Amycolatopsis anabasis]